MSAIVVVQSLRPPYVGNDHHLTPLLWWRANERRARRRSVAQATVRGQRPSSDAAVMVEGQQGLVIEVSTGMCRVDTGERTILCQIRNHLRPAASIFPNVGAGGGP